MLKGLGVLVALLLCFLAQHLTPLWALWSPSLLRGLGCHLSLCQLNSLALQG